MKFLNVLNRWPKGIAFAAGLASATGFVPLGYWPVTVMCLAVLIQLLASATNLRSALARGYWFGVGHFFVSVSWIAGAFRYQEAMPIWLGWFAVSGLALFLAIYPALAAGIAWRFSRVANAPSPIAIVPIFAGSWVLTEYLRATLFTGFAWNPLGSVFVEFAALAQGIGSYGLSGVVALAGGGLWLLFQRRWVPGLAALSLSALSAALSFAAIPGPTEGPARPLVRIVQPNIAQQDKYRDGYERENFRKLETLTGAPGLAPRLILWPEAAVPDFLGHEEWARARIARLLGPKDILITGADDLVFDKDDKVVGAHNSAFVIAPNAKVLARYDKAHLVPGGEYLPLRWLMEPLGATRLVPGDIDFWQGPGPRAIALPGFGTVGVQICYEIIFSGEVVNPKDRPDFIFNPSNDAWFGSWQPPQHLAQSRLRAVEEGLPVVRSTPTGISAIIDADGNVLRALPYQKAGFVEARLPSPKAPTMFARYGNILPIAFALFLMLIGIALRTRLR